MHPMNDQTYKLAESERRHISEVQAQMQNFQNEILQLEGQVHLRERELSFMRRHLSLYIGQMATDHGLPMGSALTQDLTMLVAREGAGNGVAG